MSAISAAFLVSPPKPDTKDAAKPVTFSMYSFADIPAVLNAFFEFLITMSAESSNNLFTPPMFCSNEPTPSSALFVSALKAVTPAAPIAPTAFKLVEAIPPILPSAVSKPPVSSLVSNIKRPSALIHS